MTQLRRNPSTGQIFALRDGDTDWREVQAQRNPDTGETFIFGDGDADWQSVGSIDPDSLSPPARTSPPPSLPNPGRVSPIATPDAPNVPESLAQIIAASPAPRATAPAPLPVPQSPAVPPRPMPANPVLDTDGPGAGGGLLALMRDGILPRRYEEGTPQAQIEEPTAPEAQQPFSDLGRRAVRGLATVPAAAMAAGVGREGSPNPSFPEFLDDTNARIAQQRAQLAFGNDLLRRGVGPDGTPLTEAQRLALQDARQAGVRQIRQLQTAADAMTPNPPATWAESQSYSAAADLRQWAQDLVGEPDAQFDDRLSSALAEGAGNMVGFLTVGILTGGIGAAATGAALNAEQVYNDALAYGADEQTARRAARWGAAVGSSEVVPIMRALRPLERYLPGIENSVARAIVRRIGGSATEEGIQEGGAQILNNLIAAGIYDPERGFMEGVTEAAIVGAILGGGLGAGGAIVAPEPQRPERPALPPPAPAADLIGAMTGAPTAPAPPPAEPPAAQAPETPASPQSQPPEGAASPVVPSQPPARDEVQWVGPSPAAGGGGAINPAEWNEISGIGRDGNETGNRFMENTRTGEVLPRAEYERRLGQQAETQFQSPQGEGEVAPTQGEDLDETAQAPSERDRVDPVAGDASDGEGRRTGDRREDDGRDRDAGFVPAPAGAPRGSASRDADPSEDAPVPRDAPAPLDAGDARPPAEPGVDRPAQDESTGAAGVAPVSTGTLPNGNTFERDGGVTRVRNPRGDVVFETRLEYSDRELQDQFGQARSEPPAAARAPTDQVPMQDSSGRRAGSWMVINRETGAVREIQNAEALQGMDFGRYEPVPAGDYLAEINGRPREDMSDADRARMMREIADAARRRRLGEQESEPQESPANQPAQPREMPRSEFDRKPDDYKTDNGDGTGSVLELDPGTGATVSTPVRIVEDAPQDRRAEWDAMSREDRERLLRSLGGFDKRDGNLTRGGQNAIGKKWDALSAPARRKIEEAWADLADTERFLAQTPEEQKAEIDRAQAEAEAAAKAKREPAPVDSANTAPTYVSRPLLNAEALVEWAREQGFKSTLAPEDMHVTIVYSKEPVDQSQATFQPQGATLTVTGGKRSVEQLGDEGAIVLRFESDDLQDRWQETRDAGASWDFPSYKPHVTITYNGQGIDIDAVEPFDGPLEFGAESVEDIDPDAQSDAQSAEQPLSSPVDNPGKNFGDNSGDSATSQPAPDLAEQVNQYQLTGKRGRSEVRLAEVNVRRWPDGFDATYSYDVPGYSGGGGASRFETFFDTPQEAIADVASRIRRMVEGDTEPRPGTRSASQAKHAREIMDWLADLENGSLTPIDPDTGREIEAMGQGGAEAAPATPPSQQDTAEPPTVRLARKIMRDVIDRNGPKTNHALMQLAAKEFGGTIADGAFSPKDAYEALELAVNLGIQKVGAFHPGQNRKMAERIVGDLQDITDALPTQTRRDLQTDAFQQFSTPPAYSYAVNWVANIPEDARVLEPSAGNGGIAVFAANTKGARVDVNELADRRVPSLKALDFDRVTTENAEQIGNIWANDATRQYDVVVMNPPFSASAGRTSKNTSATGAKHIEQALSLLKPGGRLVAIMGHTFRPSNSRVAPFFNRLGRTATLRANVEVNGSEVYKKYGTSYDSRLLVIDKIPSNGQVNPVDGRAESIPDLLRMLEDVRNGTHYGDGAPETGRTDGGASDGEGGDAPSGYGGAAGRPDGERERGAEPDDLGRAGARGPRDGGLASADGGEQGADGDSEGRPGQGSGREGAGGTGADGGSRRTPGDRQRPSVRVRDADTSQVEETAGGFAKYRPTRVRIDGAKEHPMLLVESSAMASVSPPRPDYDLQLPAKMVKDGLLSEAQLEQVLYAGAAHAEMLPAEGDAPAKRKGYFIGDGTGVGKTREIAGIIADNWAQGRKRHILISKDKKLLKSARRDFDNVGMKSVKIADLGGVKPDQSIPKKTDGVMFATYSTLARNPRAGQKSRIEQLVEWLGPDFDGTITFDEAHLAGNAVPIKGKRGTSKPSSTALAVLDLQQQLPNARVVYASATGATEVYNLAYADRLGLWGPGTPFTNVLSFVSQIEKGGIAAMEVVARDMKQMGVYMARSLSFEGVEYTKVEHTLTDAQKQMYNASAQAWQRILSNVQQVIQDHTEGGGRQRGAALAQFWGSHQRFFQQVLTSMQMPSVINAMKADLKAGRSPVVQIVNTNEAATNRAVGKMEEGDTLDDIDITPRDDLIQYLETSFPIHQYEEYEDDNGNIRTRPAKDSSGNFIVNAEAVRVRDELVGEMAAMRLPGNPLDLLIETFGADRVAEVTGRSTRIVTVNGKKKTERRTQTKTMGEAADFMAGKRDVLIFSDAGGTGMDFHADLGVKNQNRRAHYVLQAGWRADRAIQGFGRTHRTNQKEPPIYKLAGTNLSGHKRFTSSIARRLDQLGALTKGQKDASGSGMFSATDNLENEHAEEAVVALMREIYSGDLEGWTGADLESELGLQLVGEKGFNTSKVPPVPQFLNRLLNVTIERQNQLFDRFIEHMEVGIQAAIERGEYTSGVEEITHNGAQVADTKLAYSSPDNAAQSEYHLIKLREKTQVTPFEDIARYATVMYKRHKDTGAVFAFRPASTRTDERGEVIPTYHRYSATDRSVIDSTNYRFDYEIVQEDEARAAWQEQIDSAPPFTERMVHMVTGALLPIWDRLPTSSPRIVRIRLDDGRTLLGRQIPDQELTRTLENLGVGAPEIDMDAAGIMRAVMAGQTVTMSSGHRVERRRVGGEPRVEMISPPMSQYEDARPGGTFQRLGFQVERINYKARAFVPNSEDGQKALTQFMRGKSIVNVASEKAQAPKSPVRPFGTMEQNGRVFKALRKELNSLGLRDVELQYDPGLAHQGKVYSDHWGKVAITLGNTLNPRATIGHEALHVYRHMGLFTPAEWATLSRKAETDWMERYGIADRYPDLTRGEQIEEAVAEAFAEAYAARRGEVAADSGVRAAFRKFANLLKALQNWARGMGFQTPADIIHAMARGEFAKRKRPAGWASQAERLMREQRRPDSLGANGGRIHLPDRRVWEELTASNLGIMDRLRNARGALGDRFDLVRTRVQDRLLPMLRAQQVLQRALGGQPLPEELNVYLAEEMYAGRAGHKIDMIDNEYLTPIIQIIGKTKGMTPETVGQYLYARHAQERNARIAEINPDMMDGGSGMADAEARAILDAIEASEHAEKYAQIGKMIDDLREWGIAERVKHGLMSEFEANAWRQSYMHYVPLKGWAETDHSDAELDLTGIGRGYNIRGQETRRAMGRSTEAFNPLVAAITQAQEVAIRSEKNRVGQHLYRLAKDVPARKLWSVKRAETKRVFNETTGLVEERSFSPITLMQAANEVAVKVNGEEHRITLHDQRLARAMTQVGVDSIGPLTRVLMPISRYISAVNTMLDPEFVIRNFFRDAVTANIVVQSREKGAKIQRGMMRDLPKALMGAYRGLGGRGDTEWSRYFQEYSEAGGKISFWVLETPESNESQIRRRINLQASGAKGMARAIVTPSLTLNPVLAGIERVNLAVDNAIRLAAFVNARRVGYSTQEAASVAKNLTVNFNRRGEYGTAINSAYVFGNAAIQGSHVVLKAVAKSRKVQAISAGLIGLGFLLDQANTYLSDEDEDGQLAYDKVPDWQHEMNLIIMMGRGRDTADDAARVWLPYGFNVFPYIGNRISQVQRGRISSQDAIGDVARVFFNAFSPINGQDFISLVTPTVLDPAVEIATNTDWLGRPIFPDYPNMTEPDHQRYFASASWQARAMTEAINDWTGGTYAESGYVDVSPETVDHIAAFLLGGVGRTGGRFANLLTETLGGRAGELETNDIPFLRSLYTETGPWIDRSLYFERREEIRAARDTARTYEENGDPVPAHVRWRADLYELQLRTERQRRGQGDWRGGAQPEQAYLALNRAYVRAWESNTPYSPESIFD